VPAVAVVLPDGAPLRLRIGTPDDEGELLAGFAELGAESRYRRFFTAKPHLSESILEHLVAVDRERHVAIGAFDPARPSAAGGSDGAGVAVVRIIRVQPDSEDADFSIAVIDAYQGRGIGPVLMQAAAVVADQIGVKRLHGTVLAENQPMQHLAKSLGAERIAVDDPSIHDYAIDVHAVLAELGEERRVELSRLW
jgi:GNAT superfamily N-acetyltransferase